MKKLFFSATAILLLCLIFGCAQKDDVPVESMLRTTTLADTEPIEPVIAEPVYTLPAPTIDGFLNEETVLTVRAPKYNLFFYSNTAEKYNVKITMFESEPTDAAEGVVIFEENNYTSKKVAIDSLKDGAYYRFWVQSVRGDELSEPVERTMQASLSLVDAEELEYAITKNNIAAGSNAELALRDINSYFDKLYKQTDKPLLFFFEGCGSNFEKRFGAMCVLVKDGKIVYLNRQCSTIPDYPFDPSKNSGTDMGTVIDGIYNFSTVNHRSKYAALNINNPTLVRFKNQNEYYKSTGSGFNIHKRSCDGVSTASWVNSAGCFLVGATGTDEYINFIKAVGIIDSKSTEITLYSKSVSGIVIINRSYATDYLSSLGYPAESIAMIQGLK